MAKSQNQKLKLLYILKMLTESSDEQHVLSTREIISRLAADDIHAERKSIYADMNQLMDFGYDIIQVTSRLGGGYFMAGREFQLAELKLLVDAVASSRFITTRKSRELIRKLECMTSRHNAGSLQRQVYVAGRIKTENESIYYSIDSIHKAIQENCQIRFTYLEWTANRELRPRKDGEKYQVSPWALIWREENYYLAAYDTEAGRLKHYRVDKMGPVELTEIKRDGMEQAARVDLAAYANATFGMFGGEEETVVLQFPRRLIGVALDRFGRDADMRPAQGDMMRIRVKVIVSGQFFGWLSGIGKDVCIASPPGVREQYAHWLRDILNQYS